MTAVPSGGDVTARHAATETTVDALDRTNLGDWIEVPSRDIGGYLYVIRDEYHDGYPSRYLLLIGEDGIGEVEEEFTDAVPSGYPKTLRTRCLIRDELPAVGAGQLPLSVVCGADGGWNGHREDARIYVDRIEDIDPRECPCARAAALAEDGR